MTTQQAQQPTANLTIPDDIRNFIDGLLEDAKIQTPDEAVREEIVKDVYLRLDHFLTTVMLDNIPQEHLETFMKLNETGKSKAEIEQFIKEKVPNSENVFARALIEFRDMYLGNKPIAK